jgi:SAM-dependent methyltransferase
LKNNNDWHKQWFDQDYLKIYSHRNDQEAADFLDLLIHKFDFCTPLNKKQIRLLDLCCGNGRHSIEMAKRGFDVVALDWSSSLLQQAHRSSLEAGMRDKLIIVRGDLLQLPFTACFDRVLSLFSSFGYHIDDKTNSTLFADMLNLLRPKGQIVFDFLNPAKIKASLVAESQREVGDLQIRERRRIREDLNMVEKEIQLKSVTNERTVIERVKLYEPQWFIDIAIQAGFKLNFHLGNLKGDPWSLSTERSILIFEAN